MFLGRNSDTFPIFSDYENMAPRVRCVQSRRIDDILELTRP